MMAKINQVRSINLLFFNPEAYFTISQTSRLLGLPRSYFYYAVKHEHVFPKPLRFGQRLKFLGWDLLAIIELRRHKGM